MNNVRMGKVGIIEKEELTKFSIHFSEWWNGEGVDIHISRDKEELRFSLHMEEANALVTALDLLRMIDIGECIKESRMIEHESETRASRIQTFKEQYK